VIDSAADILHNAAPWPVFDIAASAIFQAVCPEAHRPVGRDIRQILPVVGSFEGMTDAFQGMSVEVQVSS
jgi:hypothetical protein